MRRYTDSPTWVKSSHGMQIDQVVKSHLEQVGNHLHEPIARLSAQVSSLKRIVAQMATTLNEGQQDELARSLGYRSVDESAKPYNHFPQRSTNEKE